MSLQSKDCDVSMPQAFQKQQTGKEKIDFCGLFPVKYPQPSAGVVELADTHGSGPCARKGVKVQVLSPAPLSILYQAAIPVTYCGLFCI